MTVYRYTAFEANPHTAQRAARLTCYRAAEGAFAMLKNSGRDCGSFADGYLGLVYRECDQCSANVLDGKYGAGSIAGVRPRIASVISSAVPSDVVMPSPSWPAAM